MATRGFPLSSLAPSRLVRRLVDLLGPTGGAARQSLVALVFNSATSFIAGATLVGILGSFQALPGSLIMVTPAIGLRGNVFSTLGNRLSTSIHTGTFSLSFRRGSVLRQNLAASFCLTMTMSAVLAALAKIVAVTVGIEHSISLLDLATISILGGLLGSIPVALATIALTVGAVRFDWDLDNLVAPTVSTLGDVITIPALWVATLLVGHGALSPTVGGIMILLSVGLTIGAWRSAQEILQQVIRESIPVLLVALALSTLGGLVIQKQVNALALLPAILVAQPAFVSSAGALGSILSGRVATNLHLGSVDPTLVPGRLVRQDTAFLFGLAMPIFIFNALGATLVAGWTGSSQAPGFGWTLLATLLAALVTMTFVVAVSYYATIGAWRVEVDPDSVGVPVVTAAVDFIGTVVLIFTVVSLSLT